MRIGDRVSGVGLRASGIGLPGIVLAVGGVLCAAAMPVAGQTTHVLVVTGLGGSPEHVERFADWGGRLRAAALAEGVPAENVVWLAERESLADGVAGVSRLDAVAEALDALVTRSGPGDVVLVAFFGHGSARGGESRINLPGPDLSATGLAELLAPFSDRRVVVVNAASASGGFVEPLAAPGRVVMTATRTPGEAEATRFGGHFVRALEGGVADADRDGRVSLLEAFEYARREVARSFADGGHLPTEHALLDDDGDGRGSLEPGGDGDGRLAAELTLRPAGVAAAGAAPAESASPELDSLRAREAALRSELEALRTRRDSMAADAYEAELERLLLEIARTGRAIRDAGGSSRRQP